MFNKIQNALNNVKGSTIAQIELLTPVTVSAANKKAGIVIEKQSTGSVMLFNNINDTTDPYLNKVLKTSNAESFEKTATYFHHLDTYSLCKHNTKDEYYLSLIWNNSKADYFINGKLATREQVAQYQTPAEAKKTLDTSGVVVNVKNNIEHQAIFRIVKLENIKRLAVAGKVITA
jgi:hypothetical protein